MPDRDDDVLELPWWFSWWRVAGLTMVLTLALTGIVVRIASSPPGAGSVDVGFLQDMRTHHDQAVEMSLVYMRRPDVNPNLRTIAGEILLSQQQETGIMVEILRRYGAEEENSSGTSMGWMHEPVPTERMPGLASQDEVDQLNASNGAAADALFLRLMIAHHQGGIHMAQYAGSHASEGRVRELAAAMAQVQQSEVDEMNEIRQKLGI